MLGLAACGVFWAEAAPRPSGVVAAVFPPWWSRPRIAAAAVHAGRIVAAGGVPFVIALKSSLPGLAARAHAAGAWLVVDRDPRDLCDSAKEPAR